MPQPKLLRLRELAQDIAPHSAVGRELDRRFQVVVPLEPALAVATPRAQETGRMVLEMAKVAATQQARARAALQDAARELGQAQVAARVRDRSQESRFRAGKTAA